MDNEPEMAVKPERLARVEQTIHEATNRAAEEVHRGASSARAGLEGVADRVEGTLGEARQRVDELADTTLGGVRTEVTNLVKKHPGKALLISFAAGFLLASVRRRD